MASPSSSSYQKLLDLLECPVCMEYMAPPIFQCFSLQVSPLTSFLCCSNQISPSRYLLHLHVAPKPNVTNCPWGHTLCSDCKPKARNACPLCREELGNIRALPLEKMCESIQIPCKYKSSGCSVTFKVNMKQNHEEECGYRPYNCPFLCFSDFSYGNLDVLIDHLSHEHGSGLKDDFQIDTLVTHDNPYDEEKTSSIVMVYGFEPHRFCLHFEAFHSPVDVVYVVFLTFLGEEIDAMGYRYQLEIGDDMRRLTWQGVPRSIREGIPRIRDSHDGLVIHRSTAQKFAETNSMEELALRVRGSIWITGGDIY